MTQPGRALAYGIGVGRDGFTWSGSNRISRKADWPGWTPPAVMRSREAKKGRILPVYMPGGPDNPLGARAMYIGSTVYCIHGTNQPWTIGQAMSSDCIRMANDDVKHLYDNDEGCCQKIGQGDRRGVNGSRLKPFSASSSRYACQRASLLRPSSIR